MEGKTAATFGVWVNITDLNDTTDGVYRDVKQIYIHPFYREDNLGNLQNDIPLLLLDSPIDTITPVEYPATTNVVISGDTVIAIGWDDTNLNPPIPNRLQGVDLTIRSIASFRRDYGDSLTDRHPAASSPDRDTCQGDSGGPLFVGAGGTGGNDLVIEITSFGLGCAAQSLGIYANVGKYNSWIDAFLAAPGDVDPAITITGKSDRLLTNGTRQRARYLGTHWGRRYKRNKGKTLSYRIQNAVDTTPALIRQVRATGRGFTVKVKPPYVFGGTSQRLAFRFRAPNKTRTNKGVARVYTSAPNNPIYSFDILAKSKRAKGGGGLGFF